MADIWDIELAKQTGFYAKAYAFPNGIEGKAWVLHDANNVPYANGHVAGSQETKDPDGAVYITYAFEARLTEAEAWEYDCPVMVFNENA